MDQVGRYQILEELGRGAHGVVYKARDPAIGRTVAIKSIALNSAIAEDRERVREGILREARLAGTLSHPNIVTVYDVQDSGDSANIFMEYVDGTSLEWAISSTKAKRPDALTRGEFLAILKQVAGALDYAHRKGVVHRDIKPANIVLMGRNQGADGTGSADVVAKIADFGVAKLASHEVTQSLTGTPNYMSPEQVQGSAVSGASDQFSLAVIAYEVLCGRKAFFAETIEALLYKIKNEREDLVDKVNPTLSQTVRKVMQCAMAKNPQQRFSSCGEFAGALEFALGDSRKWTPRGVDGPKDPTLMALIPYEEPDPEEQRTGTGKRWAMMAGLCLAVALAIVLIVRMNSGSAVVTQVLDTKNSPVSPAPSSSTSVEELKYDRHLPAPIQPAASAIPRKPLPAATDNVPTVVKVPVPVEAAKRTSRRKLFVPKPTVRQVATSGEVQLLTDPPGASITVDGMNSCVTPCSLTLSSGRHTLAANMNGFGIARRIFNVPADTNLFIPMTESVGVLMVSSDPPGANVNVDGRAVGTTPITLRLPAGSHRVSVWDGMRWHDESVQVAADEVHTRAFRF